MSVAVQTAPLSFRHFRDTDAGLLRCSILIGDTDEWSTTGQRVRIFRNGSSHFCVCECSATGKPHPAITAMVPDAIGVPGCALIVSVQADQVDSLLESFR
jgi:hypothetical protein